MLCIVLTPRINYDKKYDTLYVALQDNENSYGDDSQDDIILLRDMATRKLTGFTVLSFCKKYRSQRLPHLPEEVPFSFADIMSKIEC